MRNNPAVRNTFNDYTIKLQLQIFTISTAKAGKTVELLEAEGLRLPYRWERNALMSRIVRYERGTRAVISHHISRYMTIRVTTPNAMLYLSCY